MTDLVFYEKPGCTGNRQQQVLLRSLGHRLEVRDLLSEPWTAEELRPFLADKAVPGWFNPRAPQVKSGAIDIHNLDASRALALLLAEPLLICRPLLQYGDIRQSGFGAGPVLNALQVPLDPEADLQSCPQTATGCG
ncbi:MAG TPA: nitrogenase-associated protein [Gammaproteobacteria bacterium]|nr:nitrogenase-associated protein [Gammaproteobacteria bacterium]